ncbi:unnamed protein product [Gongylonema pulchrum]|uniref:Uncharacterized protein n=1 Tax=Gongylonema pulchrum TaxID=637853 RepID=A0A183D298_9BILA|nr:unnamed protein product [Gongylonema pulchrum]
MTSPYYPYPPPLPLPFERYLFPPPFLFPPSLPPQYFGGAFFGPTPFPHFPAANYGKFDFDYLLISEIFIKQTKQTLGFACQKGGSKQLAVQIKAVGGVCCAALESGLKL